MLLALARAATRAGALVPALALALGGLGAVLPRSAPDPNASADSAQDPDLAQVDGVLSRRVPELGLSLRRRVADAILEESRTAGFDPLLILGLIEVESEFDGAATSGAGARGLMQLRPVTAEYLAAVEGLRLTVEEIYRDPAIQVRLGVRYLSRLERRFRSLDLALMAYNAGPEKLKATLETGEAERFRNYVKAVKRRAAHFRAALAVAAEGALAQAGELAEP
jgi:soluble lytic murein transglycosylase-like protein